MSKIITNLFEQISKIIAVAIAPALVFSTTATNILFPLAIICGLIGKNLYTKLRHIICNPVAIAFILFYALFLLGSIYSDAPSANIMLTLRKYDKFLFAAFLIPLFTEDKWRKYAINTYLIAIVILLGISYLKVFSLLPNLHNNDTYFNTAEIFRRGIEFNFLLSFAAYLVLFKITKIKNFRIPWIILLLLLVCNIIFYSSGRTGYIVFICLVVLFALQRLKWQQGLIIITILAALYGLAFTLSPVFKNRIDAAFNDIKIYKQTTDTSLGWRMSFVKGCVKLIKKHPIFGTGTGSYPHEYFNITKTLSHNPHNEYLFIGVQFGLVGIIILLLFFATPLWYSQFLEEEQKYIARGVIVGIMVGCLANSWLLDTVQGHFYAYFIAMMFANQKCRGSGSNRHGVAPIRF